LIGAGAGLVIVVALLVMQAVNFGGYGGTTIVTTTQHATDIVGASFAEHMHLLGSRNASAVVSQYEGNATVTWKGVMGPNDLAGTYNGAPNITRLLEAFFFEPYVAGNAVSSFATGNVTRTITATSDESVAVSSSFGFAGQCPLGRFPRHGFSSGLLLIFRHGRRLAYFAGDLEFPQLQCPIPRFYMNLPLQQLREVASRRAAPIGSCSTWT
jgi:hypothetical protein